MGISIITKDNCSWCVKAKQLLKATNHPFQEINIPYNLSREEFFDLVEKYNTSKTVPKIFDGKDLIGGYEDLTEWLETHSGGFGEGSLS